MYNKKIKKLHGVGFDPETLITYTKVLTIRLRLCLVHLKFSDLNWTYFFWTDLITRSYLLDFSQYIRKKYSHVGSCLIRLNEYFINIQLLSFLLICNERYLIVKMSLKTDRSDLIWTYFFWTDLIWLDLK